MNANTTILLVEDDRYQAELIQLRIGTRCKLIIVDCMLRAVEWLKNNHADAILLDVGLPDTANDLDSIKQIKVVRGKSAIVILSGNGDPNFIRDAIRSSANGFLSKGHGDRTYLDIATEVDKAIENNLTAQDVHADNKANTGNS